MIRTWAEARASSGVQVRATQPSSARALALAGRGLTVAVALVGATVLLGWLLDVPPLKSLLPSFASMKPNTAACFLLLGSALYFARSPRASPRRRHVAIALVSAAALVSSVTLLEYVLGWDLGIDQALFRDPQSPTVPGRMSVATALNFVAASAALLMLDARQGASRRRPSEWLAAPIAITNLLVVLGYAYGVRSLYALAPFHSIALHTALAFVALAFAIAFTDPEEGWMRLVTSDDLGGAFARRVLPAALLVPPVLGWARLWGERQGFYGTAFGLALFASANVVCFVAVTLGSAASLVGADSARRQAEAAVREREEALARSRGRFARLSEAGILGIVVATLDGRILEINDALLDTLGYSRDEVLSGAVHGRSFTPSEWRDVDVKAIEELRTRGVASLRAKEYKRRDGTRIKVLVGSALLPEGDGEAISFVLDVSGNKAAATALEGLREARAAETRFRGLLEAAPDGVVIVDAKGRIALVNGQTERLFGYARAELVGQPVELLLPDQARARHADHRAEFGRAPKVRAMGSGLDLRARRKDGSEFPIEVSLSPLEAEGETLVVSAIRDVTERRKLTEQRSRLAALVDATDDAVVGKTLDGVITSWNAGAERIFGYTAEEAIGRSMTLVMPPGREEEERSILERLRRGEPIHFDTVRRRKDGRDIDVSLTICPVRDAKGTLIGASKVARDITARRQAEEALAQARDTAEAASRELEAFSYSVAHDLRAPLRGMNGFAQILLDSYQDKLDAEGREFLHDILGNARKMAELIDALLGLARVTRSEPRRASVDLSGLVRETLAPLQTSEPTRAVAMVVEEGVTVDVDPILARALVENLLGNAWKFTAKTAAARIEFGATARDGERAFFVRDNGAGFDMAYANKLFAPFQRLHTTEEFAGTGIGLATVQRIVRRHGGRVWAEGAVNAGATFYFTLRERAAGAAA